MLPFPDLGLTMNNIFLLIDLPPAVIMLPSESLILDFTTFVKKRQDKKRSYLRFSFWDNFFLFHRSFISENSMGLYQL